MARVSVQSAVNRRVRCVSVSAGRTIVQKVSGVARWAQRGAPPPVAASTGVRGTQRLQQLWDQHGAARLQGAREGLTLNFFLKVRA